MGTQGTGARACPRMPSRTVERMNRRYDFSVLSVMVVDDNQYMQQIIKTILNSMLVKDVHGFTNPADAFADLENWQPDIVFVDWMMDPINGLEFVQLTRQSESALRFIPLVLLTGHADQGLVKQGRDKGADYTIAKPVSLNAVYRTFVRLIENPRQFVQTPTFDGPDRRSNPEPADAGEYRLMPSREVS